MFENIFRLLKKVLLVSILLMALLMLGVTITSANTDCTFTISGMSMTLDGNCTTDSTIYIPDGSTLNGAGYTITAIDPSGGHFTGAIIQNEGATAYVSNVSVTVSGLANVCDSGDDRLRGIMFEGASGIISGVNATGINQGASGCQEGNAIEVRNAPFDGTHPNTQTVEISNSTITSYQKTGIVANGDVNVTIQNNYIGPSATQENLAANSVQIGFGAIGLVQRNNIEGNQWKGTSDFAASAVLVFSASETNVSQNNIRGNSDIGLFIFSDNGYYDNNRIFDEGEDHPNSGYDIGLGNYGNNVVTNNKIRGFDSPSEGDNEGEVLIPSPNN